MLKVNIANTRVMQYMLRDDTSIDASYGFYAKMDSFAFDKLLWKDLISI